MYGRFSIGPDDLGDRGGGGGRLNTRKRGLNLTVS